MAEADVRVAPLGALLVDSEKVAGEPHGPTRGWVEADPSRDCLDRRCLTPDRCPPLGREASDPAAERPQLELLAEAGKGLRPDSGPADDPGAATLESRVDEVGVGDVLEPAGDRVEAAAAARGGVRDARPDRLLVHPPRPGAGHDLHRLRGYFSSSPQSLITVSRGRRTGPVFVADWDVPCLIMR